MSDAPGLARQVPEAPDASAVPRARLLGLALVLAALTFWLYLPTWANGFVDYDDGSYVTQNPDVAAGWTVEGVAWAFTAFHSSNWHPLTWLSHMLDCELFGLEPAGHHLVSAGWHALNAALAFLFLALACGRAVPALLVALWFAVHPLRVESVAWVSERKDVLSGAFFFLALLAYRAWTLRPSALRYARVVLAFGLGLLAKQMLVTLPFLLLLLDVWPLGRTSVPLARRLLEKLPLFGMALAAGLVTVLAQSSGAALRSVEALPLDVRFANAVSGYADYLLRSAWPGDLAFFYPHPWLVSPEGYEPLGARVLGALALLLGVSALAFVLRRRAPAVPVGWLWYLGLLVPVIGIVQVGAHWRADRYAYLPTLGLYVALVYGTTALLRGRRAARALPVLGLLGFGLAIPWALHTRRQIAVWRDSETLFVHALEVTERNYVAHSNLGFYLHQRGRRDEARGHYEQAIAFAPRLMDARSNLGALHLDLGELDAARACLEEALAIAPGHANARLLLALLEERSGHPARALAEYRRALALNPDSQAARVALGAALGRAGEHEEALALLREVTRAQPNHARAWSALAQEWVRAGEPERAAEAFGRARAERAGPPDGAELRRAHAWFLATAARPGLRDPARALALLDRDGERTWEALRARAAALGALGRFPEARRLALEARVEAPAAEHALLERMYAAFEAERSFVP